MNKKLEGAEQGKQSKSQKKARGFDLLAKLVSWKIKACDLFNYALDDRKIETFKFSFDIHNSKLLLLNNPKTGEYSLTADTGSMPTGKQSPMELLTAINLHIDKSKLVMEFEEKLKNPGLILRREKDDNNQQKGYQLSVGEVIKLGRVRYLVRELRDKERGQQIYHKQAPAFLQAVSQLEMDEKSELQIKQQMKDEDERENSEEDEKETDVPQSPMLQSIEESTRQNVRMLQRNQQTEAKVCKICLEGQTGGEDILINACKCKGSVSSIHLSCLRRWLSFKVKVWPREYCSIFSKIECELCKSELPLSLSVDSKQVELFPVKRPSSGPYLLLEKIAPSNNKNLILIHKVPTQGISIGRSQSAFITIKDVTISKLHAFIKLKEGNFYAFDASSKFGTIIERDQFSLKVGNRLRGVQLGNMIALFTVKPRDAGRPSQKQEVV